MKRFAIAAVLALGVLPASGSTLYGPLIDPSPMGSGFGGGRPVALLESDFTRFAVWAASEPGMTHDIFKRALSFSGKPLREARELVGRGSFEAAASNGHTYLVAWAADDIRVQLFDPDGVPTGSPIVVSSRAASGETGITSLQVVGVGASWWVLWTRPEQLLSEIRPVVEGIRLDSSGRPTGSTRLFAQSARLLGVQSLGTDTFAIITRDEVGLNAIRFRDGMIVDSRAILAAPAQLSVVDISLDWSDDSLFVVVLFENTSSHAQFVRQAEVVFSGSPVPAGPEVVLDDKCSAISSEWLGSENLIACGRYLGSFGTEFYRFSRAGTRSSTQRPLFGLGAGDILSRSSELFVLTTTERDGINLLVLDGPDIDREFLLSNRAANTMSILRLPQWSDGDKLLLWTSDGRIRADLATRDGLTLTTPVSVSDRSFAEFAIARNGDRIFLVASNQVCELSICSARARIWIFDALSPFPIPVASRDLEIVGPLSLAQAAAGPAGLALRFQYTSSSPTGRLVLLDPHTLGILKERSLTGLTSDREGMFVFDDRIIVVSSDSSGGRVADVFDSSLQNVQNRVPIADSASGVTAPTVSRRDDRGLYGWIDPSGRAHSVVLDINANILGTAFVTPSGGATSFLNARPSDQGWTIGWLRNEGCVARTVQVGLSGQPVGGIMNETLEFDCDAIDVIDPLEPWVLWSSIRRLEQPWGAAYRALVAIAPAEDTEPEPEPVPRRRGVNRH